MTSAKQLKVRVRTRMAATGERYVTARRHVLGPTLQGPVVDGTWTLDGGVDPDAAALTSLLAYQGVTGPDGPLPEETVFLCSGGLGAGYILWEFAHDHSRIVTLGFGHAWNYLDARLAAAVSGLGLDAEWHRTGGAAGAGARLNAELARGRPVVVWPDWYRIGYWHLPPAFDCHGGHPVVAYAASGDRIHLDDRTLSPLTVGAAELQQARSRVGSYRNALFALRNEDVAIPGDRLRAAVRDGLRTTADHLGERSESFAVPAWRKWARLLLDAKAPKGWPRVFADGRELFGALLSVWEGVAPAGMAGGHLRDLFAAGLDQAAELLDQPVWEAEAGRWREISRLWLALAEAAAPATNPVAARARELTAAVTGAVAEGDAGRAERAAAAEQLWALRAEHADQPPFDAEEVTETLAAMSGLLDELYAAETAGVERLRTLLG